MKNMTVTHFLSGAISGLFAFSILTYGAVAEPEQQDATEDDATSMVRIIEDDGKKTIIIEMDEIQKEIEILTEDMQALADDLEDQAFAHLDRSVIVIDDELASLEDIDVEITSAFDDADKVMEFELSEDGENETVIYRIDGDSHEKCIKTDDEETCHTMTDEEKEAFEARHKDIKEKIEKELVKAKEYRKQALAKAEEGLRVAKDRLRSRQEEVIIKLERRKTDQ